MAYRISNQFHFKDGYLFCEDVRVTDLAANVERCGVTPPSPLFVYSKSQLLENIQAYRKALATLSVPSVINYSMKANANVSLLKLIRGQGCCTTLVSGLELEFGRVAGFHPQRMMFNGNGKTRADVEKAVRLGCLVNVDSDFDCRKIDAVCQQLGTKTSVLLRVNPDVDPKVHPYVSTGLAGSKFGVCVDDVDQVVKMLSESSYLHLVGLHCHVGSTVRDVSVFRSCLQTLLDLRRSLQQRGFTDIRYINLGGGLMIDYETHADRTHPARLDTDEELKAIHSQIDSHDSHVQSQLNSVFDDYKAEKMARSQLLQRLASITQSTWKWNRQHTSLEIPTPADLIGSIRPLLTNEKDLTLIVEPGRSLLGNTAILMTSVLGSKKAGLKRIVCYPKFKKAAVWPCLMSEHIVPT
ncbi:probable diaminopimelate decarboxylase, chloroplastic isoform X2 [Gigantopelta aegis]|uniref:probable diaminopimelate decarboxylase, chloroplastic isoform X2 n=1 Tax=Gigantopelta aegis TaxID=1735272 RepID=UPI001B887738|nr:probable diaminopimelate decarboxylase, chloroplastic isoform X2 [Gigantopelta aegis]